MFDKEKNHKMKAKCHSKWVLFAVSSAFKTVQVKMEMNLDIGF